MIATMETPVRKFIRAEEAAHILNVSSRTIRRYIADKLLRGYRLPTGMWFASREDCERWVEGPKEIERE